MSKIERRINFLFNFINQIKSFPNSTDVKRNNLYLRMLEFLIVILTTYFTV